MILRFLLGSILALASVIFAILASGGSPALFATPYALVLSVALPIGGMLAAYGPGRLGKMLRAIFSRDSNAEAELLMAKRALRTLTGLLCATGFFGFFLGELWTLACLTVRAEVGLSFARALAPVLHAGFIFLWIVLPFSCALDRKLAALEAERVSGTETPGRALPGGVSYPWIFVSLVGILSASLLLFWNRFPFFDLPSVFISVVLVFASAMIAMSPVEIARSFAIGFGRKDADAADLKRAAAGAAYLARSTVTAVLFGNALGLIYALSEWDNKNRVGPSLALCTFTAIYGLILLLFAWLPLKAALERKLADKRIG